MRFFLDNDLAQRLARMLDAFDDDHEVRHLKDRFAPNTADVDWIGSLAKDEDPPALVTIDSRIRRTRAEQLALKESNLTAFFLRKGWASLQLHELAWRLVKIWPRIVQNAIEVREPTIFEVPVKSTKIEKVTLTSHLRVR